MFFKELFGFRAIYLNRTWSSSRTLDATSFVTLDHEKRATRLRGTRGTQPLCENHGEGSPRLCHHLYLHRDIQAAEGNGTAFPGYPGLITFDTWK